MAEPPHDEPRDDSLRNVIDNAFKDFQHARDQTWKALHIVAVLGAGMVTVYVQVDSKLATCIASGLVFLAAVSGILISLKHRKVQRQKYIHIMNCQIWLGLIRHDVIPDRERLDEYEAYLRGVPDEKERDRRRKIIEDAAVALPKRPCFLQAFDPRAHNTDIFIIRMHIAIILFAILLAAFRLLT